MRPRSRSSPSAAGRGSPAGPGGTAARPPPRSGEVDMAGKRRGHGEGSIYKDSAGRWRGVVDLGWQNGKRQRKYFSGDTRREVQQRLEEARRQHEQGALALGPQQRVGQFLQGWLEDTAQH